MTDQIGAPIADDPEPSWQTTDPFLLRGLVRCQRCWRLMVPAQTVDARSIRVYSCGPSCPQPDLPAERAESDMLLLALIRGAVAATDCAFVGPAVTGAEMIRWERSDPQDRRAMLRAAYLRVDITKQGQVWPVWRHLSDGPAVGVARVTVAANQQRRPIPTPIRPLGETVRTGAAGHQPEPPRQWPPLTNDKWWEPQ